MVGQKRNKTEGGKEAQLTLVELGGKRLNVSQRGRVVEMTKQVKYYEGLGTEEGRRFAVKVKDAIDREMKV